MSFRRFAVLLITLVAVAMGGTVNAQNKVVVYSANGGNLNRFAFDGFTKETGIAVEGVTAGSGVLFRRIASEREKPLGDIVWGVSRALLQSNEGLLAPYASKNKGATPADFRDPNDLWIGTNVHLLVILQNTKLLPGAEGPKSWADLLTENGRARSHSPTRPTPAPPSPTRPCSCSFGVRENRAGKRCRTCWPTPRCSTARRWYFRASATANSRSACRLSMPGCNGLPAVRRSKSSIRKTAPSRRWRASASSMAAPMRKRRRNCRLHHAQGCSRRDRSQILPATRARRPRSHEAARRNARAQGRQAYEV